jgi:phospholipid/cholesterol/gamma-HCH transport system permease protein
MGYDSFPVVCLISFLIGVTISISSIGQLQKLGADIYLANLVGFGMIRELVPLMTGIILAGKIGASITAEISSMKVLEEVDALKSMGIIPEKFLMVPRILAITFAIPLLIGMADLVGIFGGLLVSHFFSEIPANIFLEKVFKTVDFYDFFIGLLKTMVFGWVVVISAGYKGFSVEKGAEGVGIATTQSVVLSISSIIVLDCIFALLLY